MQAHAEGNNQPTPVDEWAVRGNEAADQCASDASQHFPMQLLVLHARLTQELRTLREHGKAWHNVLLAIGQRVLSAAIPSSDAPAPEKAHPSHVVDLDLGLRCVAGALVSDFPKKFRINELQYVLDWLPTLVSDSVAVVWVSFHQLLIDYQFHSQRWGPSSTGPKWIDPNQGELYCYKQHVQWFSGYLKGICKAAGHDLDIQQRRPSSHVLAFWCGSIRVAISDERLDRVNRHFRSFAPSLPATQIERDLGEVPPGRV